MVAEPAHPGAERTRILVGLAQAGDQEAQARLFERLDPFVLQEVRRFQGRIPGLGPEDLAQEVYVAVLESLPGFAYRGQGSLAAWLRKVAHHRLLDCLERASARKRTPPRPLRHLTESLPEKGGRVSGSAGPVAAPGPTPSEILQRQEERDWIARAIRRLRGPYREVLLLAYQEGLSRREISARIGRSPEATRKLIARGIERLERTLRVMRASEPPGG